MQSQSTILFFLIFLLGAMAGEYWVLISLDPQPALEQARRGELLLLKLVSGTGLWCRLGFMVCYLAWIWVFAGTAAGGQKRAGWSHKSLIVASFLLSGGLLLRMESFPPVFIRYLYPAAFGVFVASALLLPLLVQRQSRQAFGIRNEKRKIESAWSFNSKTRDGYINVLNPFRGIFISGAAGAGKSESLAFPIIRQAIGKGYTGLVYDFKFPVLAEQMHLALWLSGRKDVSFYLLNFHDLSRSHRLNPLKANRMPVMAYAEEYSQAILNNLLPETIRKKDFWIRSANVLLTAVIWFLKKHHPQYCSLPHAVNIILYKDYLRTMSMLATDAETAGMVRSVISAIENDAEGQVAGGIGSLQLSIARINSPEILAVGTEPSLADAFSPLISCIITVALKLMNRPENLPGLVLLDEAPTLYIPKLEMIPATARSNRIATVYMAPDYTQMVDSYGKEKADVIIANLNNQFYGRVGVANSARMVSELFGQEEKEMESRSSSQSNYGNRLSSNQSVTFNRQEKQVVKPQDLCSLKEGEFVGTTVEGKESFFWSRVRQGKRTLVRTAILPFASNVKVEKNYRKIKAEAEKVVTFYKRAILKPQKGKRGD